MSVKKRGSLPLLASKDDSNMSDDYIAASSEIDRENVRSNENQVERMDLNPLKSDDYIAASSEIDRENVRSNENQVERMDLNPLNDGNLNSQSKLRENLVINIGTPVWGHTLSICKIKTKKEQVFTL
ncbi:hypothetical protein QE152_g5731 [Popillia japonica]|uniref:Uncharacterized protein n=1 Tax=Popillia japonica TaxID=7064 RepID=A0AAW1MGX2_POPJA